MKFSNTTVLRNLIIFLIGSFNIIYFARHLYYKRVFISDSINFSLLLSLGGFLWILIYSFIFDDMNYKKPLKYKCVEIIPANILLSKCSTTDDFEVYKVISQMSLQDIKLALVEKVNKNKRNLIIIYHNNEVTSYNLKGNFWYKEI